MDKLKKYAKYILFIIGGYLFTNFLIFVGFNANYHSIELVQELPQPIVIEKAEANKNQGRVYGKVLNSSDTNLNGKYIKVTVYNLNGENIATEYLKIENLKENEQKLFKATFNAKEAKSFSISIVDNE